MGVISSQLGIGQQEAQNQDIGMHQPAKNEQVVRLLPRKKERLLWVGNRRLMPRYYDATFINAYSHISTNEALQDPIKAWATIEKQEQPYEYWPVLLICQFPMIGEFIGNGCIIYSDKKYVILTCAHILYNYELELYAVDPINCYNFSDMKQKNKPGQEGQNFITHPNYRTARIFGEAEFYDLAIVERVPSDLISGNALNIATSIDMLKCKPGDKIQVIGIYKECIYRVEGSIYRIVTNEKGWKVISSKDLGCTEALSGSPLLWYHEQIKTWLTIGVFIGFSQQLQLSISVAICENSINWINSELSNYKDPAHLEQGPDDRDQFHEPNVDEEQPNQNLYSKNPVDLWSNGDYDQYIAINQRLLALGIKVYGEQSLDVALALHNLGRCWFQLKQYNESIQNYMNALSIITKLSGPRGQAEWLCLNNIGRCQYRLGLYKESLETHQRALDIRIQPFGEWDHRVAKSIFSIGKSLQKLGRHYDSQAHYNRALEIRMHLFGDDHHEVAQTLAQLGGLFCGLSRYKESIQYQRRALRIRFLIFGERNEDVALSYYILGETYKFMKNYQDSHITLQRALAIRLKLFGEKHPEVAQCQSKLAESLYALAQFRESMVQTQKALDYVKQQNGDLHPRVQQLIYHLGLCHYSLGEYNQAIKHFEESLRLKEITKESLDKYVAKSIYLIGICHYALKEYQVSLAHHVRALDLRITLFGEVNIDVAKSLEQISQVYLEMAEYIECLGHQTRAFDIRVKLNKGDSKEMAQLMKNMSLTQVRLGDKTPALYYADQAYSMYERIGYKKGQSECQDLIVQLQFGMQPIE